MQSFDLQRPTIPFLKDLNLFHNIFSTIMSQNYNRILKIGLALLNWPPLSIKDVELWLWQTDRDGHQSGNSWLNFASLHKIECIIILTVPVKNSKEMKFNSVLCESWLHSVETYFWTIKKKIGSCHPLSYWHEMKTFRY